MKTIAKIITLGEFGLYFGQYVHVAQVLPAGKS
jgi:hypothetical protein